MTFKDAFQNKLSSGADHEELIELVLQFKADGIGQREAYDRLQEIWLEYGFDDDDGESRNVIRDNLEYVMEIVWGFCPTASQIWEGSLSRQDQPT